MTDTWVVLELVLLLQIKHLIVDWCWQPEYEWKNKGTYLHFGGIRHALKNAIGTGLCFILVSNPVVMLLVFGIDFLVHYHVDWTKCWCIKRTGWTANNPEFWWLTGADQFLHQIGYLGLIWIFCL
jgi:Protein of unknown function (DUF3307)